MVCRSCRQWHRVTYDVTTTQPHDKPALSHRTRSTAPSDSPGHIGIEHPKPSTAEVRRIQGCPELAAQAARHSPSDQLAARADCHSIGASWKRMTMLSCRKYSEIP